MASRIPTILAEAQLQGGPVGPYADPVAFSDGAGGLPALGQGLADVGNALNQIAQKQKLDDENRWIAEATAKYTEQGINFLNDPKNAGREDYAGISDKFLRERQTEFLKAAPSQRARQRFDSYANSFYNNHRGPILNQTNRVKLENTKNAVKTNVITAMGAFRNSADPKTAALDAELQREVQHDSIRQIFEDISPTAERALREFIDEQFIFGTAERNPDYSRRVLADSQYIDESKRATLGNRIDQIEQRTYNMARYEFERTLDQAIRQGFDRREVIPPTSRDTFRLLYSKDEWELRFRKYEDERVEANTAIEFSNDLDDKNAAAITRKVDEFRKNANVPTRLKNLVAQQAHDLIRHQTTEPADYLVAGNDEVHSAFASFQAAPPEQKPRLFQVFANTVRKYSGRGPDDRYLGLADNQIHILPEFMAKPMRAELNKGSYSQKLEALQGFGALFEDYEGWKMGFNDLMRAPHEGEGVKPQYQVALQFLQWKDGRVSFRQPELVQSYLTAVDNEELLKDIGKNVEKYTDYIKELDSNKQWRDWVQGVLYNGQRASDVAATKEGIIAYSWMTGKTASEGVKNAVQLLIGQNQFLGTVNGQTLPMNRIRKDGSQRTEGEMEDIVRRLSVSPKYLDVDQIDKSKLFFLPLELGDNSKEARLHTLRFLMSDGFFVPESDANAVTLHVMSDGGQAVQVTDRQGNPFRIHFDNLPSFMMTRTEPVAKIGPRGTVYTGETKQVSVPETAATLDDTAFPAWQDDERTHWPLRDWTVTEPEWQQYRESFRNMMKRVGPIDPRLQAF